jgi:hexosaminidase
MLASLGTARRGRPVHRALTWESFLSGRLATAILSFAVKNQIPVSNSPRLSNINASLFTGSPVRLFRGLGLGIILAWACLNAVAEPSLWERGYTVIPAPQQVAFEGGDFHFGPGWRLELGAGVRADDVAVTSLKAGLAQRYGLTLGTGSAGRVITLAIQPGSVVIGPTTDTNREVLAKQAYRLRLAGDAIRLTANAPAGLFYGAETLVQLVKRAKGALWLPTAEIVDWPDLEQRNIYWDDNHHLEPVAVLKRALRQAAFYRINGFVLKLNGHFQYRHAPAVVEPYALSPEQLQELTDYGLKYHVQLIPYLDAPAHVAFILKHPEYARLREFPDCNYEMSTTNPNTYKLLEGMCQDLLDANRGVNYFFLSTDEPYYVGLADNDQCHSAALAKKLGGVGKVEAQFLDRTAGYVHARGRTVLFWGEYPLKPADIPSLPPYLVNGEVGAPEFDRAFKAHGIRQMIYTSTEGMEPLFPNYDRLPAARLFHPIQTADRLNEMYQRISFDPARQDAALIGVFVAGWADEGLHPETFWLGYATGPAWGWHPASLPPAEARRCFYHLFYGEGTVAMNRVYRLMSTQAEFWDSSWDTAPSTARKPIFGYSYGIFRPRHPAQDQTLPLPPVPQGKSLRLAFDWAKANARRVKLAADALSANDELLGLLRQNLKSAQFQHYNLEVFLSIAGLYRQNLEMLRELNAVNTALEEGRQASSKAHPRQAVAALDRALEIVERIREQRNRALRKAVDTWDQSWYPRVVAANGRTYLNAVDDVKDHLPMRTVDMSYLVYRELLLPLGPWYDQVQAVRNHYAQAHHLSPRTKALDWSNTRRWQSG